MLASTTNPKLIIKDVINNKAILVDVRDEEEWERVRAKEAILLSLDRIYQGESPTRNKSTHIYVYCQYGGRALVAAQILAERGYNAASIGSIHDWHDAGGAVEY